MRARLNYNNWCRINHRGTRSRLIPAQCDYNNIIVLVLHGRNRGIRICDLSLYLGEAIIY